MGVRISGFRVASAAVAVRRVRGAEADRRLLELNLTVAAMEKQDKKVTAPGIPPGYSNPARLVTDDCIRP